MIHGKVLRFHDWILSYHDFFHNNVKQKKNTEKKYSSFLKDIFVFARTCFKVLKRLRISSDSHIKNPNLLNKRPF